MYFRIRGYSAGKVDDVAAQGGIKPARSDERCKGAREGHSVPRTPIQVGETRTAVPVAVIPLKGAEKVTVGGEAAGVLYSGSAPTLESGFFQINVRLPADLTAVSQPLRQECSWPTTGRG